MRNSEPMEPRRPLSLDPLAIEILEQLRGFPESSYLILGGHFALKHYIDYRPTHDVDAWWSTQADKTIQQAVLADLRGILNAVAELHGLTVYERHTMSDVDSLALRRDGKTVFTVQIAPRSVELEQPVGGEASPWRPIAIETLVDNVGAKMNALVNRGAPRDFLDVYTVVTAGLVTADECWNWWRGKNPKLDIRLAKAQVVKHLAAIELRQPLHRLQEPERQRVDERRRWFRAVLTADDNGETHDIGEAQTP